MTGAGATRNRCVFRYIFESMDALLWLLLEAGVALALLLGIVWWTWPRSRRGKQRDDKNT
jgi:hypothetical protein